MKKVKKILSTRYSLAPLVALERTVQSFSPFERVAFYVLSVLLVVGAIGLVFNVNNLFLTSVPARGGILTEGIVGSPRFLNPLLALSDGDRDLTSLVYSGLLRATPEGTLIPDLAENYSLSDDGLSYTFVLREDATFHDKRPVTADDVIFTMEKAKDPALKSPKRANWEGVSVEKLSDREVKLTLKQPYSPFLENATMGILPKHIWGSADADGFAFSPFNTEAVGSGPYRIGKIRRNASGIPVVYELVPFDGSTLGAPYIAEITFRFYPNEEAILSALDRGEIESASSLSPEAARTLAEKNMRIERTPLPRVFAVFFNQNQAPIFADKDVRTALTLATDKDALVDSVLEGYGVPIEGPVPPLVLDDEHSLAATTTDARLAEAARLLDRAKWKLNESTGIREKTRGKEVEMLSFTLATSDVPVLKTSAQLVAEMWKRVGADVKVGVYESGDLNQNIIRPRKFEALLFGEIIGRELDLFAFWHSSQRNDPGLNIAMYTNTKVNQLLDEARKVSDPEQRLDDYRKAVAAIKADAPAVFLYSPEFIYAVPEKIRGFRLEHITTQSDRFLGIAGWYTDTEKIWNVFTR